MPPKRFTLNLLPPHYTAIRQKYPMVAQPAPRATVRGAEGYIFARENAKLAQKAQLALARMTRELTEIAQVNNSAANSIEFSTPAGLRGIGLSGTEIKISIDSSFFRRPRSG